MIDQEKIHGQCFSEDPEERIEGLKQLNQNFSHISNKQQAWSDLRNLAHDDSNKRYVRRDAILALGSAFKEISNKEKARNDLIELANSEE